MSQDPDHNEPGSELPPESSDPPLTEYNASAAAPGFPPPQVPYGTPPGYGYPMPAPGYGYPAPPPGYGYNVPPPTEPLPLWQALRQLPRQYFRVLTKPSEATFAMEMGKASWDIVWVQLLLYALFNALVSFLFISLFLLFLNGLFSQIQSSSPSSPPLPFAPLDLAPFYLGIFLGSVILVPIGFFFWEAIFYGLARAFGGGGRFLLQSYTSTLYTVPLGVISALLSWVPFIGGIASLGVLVYTIILRIFAISAVHRLSGGKAAAVVLIPVGVVFVLLIAAVFLYFFIIFSVIPPSH